MEPNDRPVTVSSPKTPSVHSDSHSLMPPTRTHQSQRNGTTQSPHPADLAIGNSVTPSSSQSISPSQAVWIPLEDVTPVSRPVSPASPTRPHDQAEAGANNAAVAGTTEGEAVEEEGRVKEAAVEEVREGEGKREDLVEQEVVEDIRYADTLHPIDVPNDYLPINFRPLVLNCGVLITILVFNVLCIASILAVLYCADRNHQYHTKYNNIYLVVRYVPTVVGTITTVLFRSLRDTFSRIQPYISMADQKGIRECPGSKSVGQLFMRGIHMNKRETWTGQGRHSLRLATTLCNFLAVQITGYKASLFSTAHSDEGWLVTVNPQMAWVLFCIYLLIIFLYCWILSKMWRASTGLKWDPVCIADMLALFHGSNVLSDFEELEQQPEKKALWLLCNKTYRLGYWEKGIGKEIWYGIGRAEPGSSSTTTESQPRDTNLNAIEYDRERYPWDRNFLFSPWTIYFWTPFVFGSLGLCIYAIASSRVKKGFNIASHTPFTNSSIPGPFTYNLTTSGGDIVFANFDPGNNLLWALFIFRTILVILSSYMAITWFGWVDESMRFSQPFKNMFNKSASADDSILLNYLWGIPGWTTIKALMNGHYTVAWFSFVTFFSPTFPILVGGLFTITNTGKRIYFAITPATFYLVFAYFIIYTISVPLAWPSRNRRLMRHHDSIADYVSLFYASYLLHDPDSKLDISAARVTKRHLESRIFLEEKEYSVGLYNGVDGKWHFGLDVATLPEPKVEDGESKHVLFRDKNDWRDSKRENRRQDEEYVV